MDTNATIIDLNGSSPFYSGNENLYKAGLNRSLNVEQRKEFIKCKLDPVYFLKKYAKVVHIDYGLINLNLYPYQEEMVNLYAQGNRKLIMNTSRQSGKTTVIVGIILHYSIFNEDKRIAILANKADQAQEILSRFQIAYEYLPLWMKPGVKNWAKKTVVLDNGTELIATASSSSAIRGKSVSFLYLDEQAFIPKWEDFSASVLPTISSGKESIMIMTSTPNGLNSFYDYCTLAKDGKNGFKYIEVPWYKVPGRDEAWRLRTLEELSFDLNKFKIEHECQFEGSSDTLIDGTTLKSLRPVNPVHSDSLGTSKQYMPAVKDHIYMMTIDVSRGKGMDFSTIQVIDVTELPYEQVFVYRNNQITPIEFTAIIYRIGKLYNNAYALVEINDIGGQVADQLFYEYDYEYILYTDSSGGRTGKKISGGFGKKVDRGIRTTKPVKALGCAMLKLLIEERRLKINDAETIFELSTFSRKNESYAAEEGKHDDLVMALVIFSWLSQDAWFSNTREINVVANLRQDSDDDIFEMLMPFGTIVDNCEDRTQFSAANREIIDGEVWYRMY